MIIIITQDRVSMEHVNAATGTERKVYTHTTSPIARPIHAPMAMLGRNTPAGIIMPNVHAVRATLHAAVNKSRNTFLHSAVGLRDDDDGDDKQDSVSHRGKVRDTLAESVVVSLAEVTLLEEHSYQL
jgi:hypothetical protein